jgi:hypothetical protein
MNNNFVYIFFIISYTLSSSFFNILYILYMIFFTYFLTTKLYIYKTREVGQDGMCR